MFLNIFINRLKCTVRDKALVFWTLFFPLILATFFNMAFSNITKHEEFTSPDIAVVDNEQYQKDQYFKDFLIEHSSEAEASNGSVKLFNVHVASLEKARKMLENGEVIGYITVGTPIGFTVKNSGFNQTIVKAIFDEYSQTASIAGNIIKNDPASVQKGLFEDIQNRKEYTREVRIGTKDKPDSMVNYFYSLIAMACMYGAFFGLKEITDTQGDLSKQAARLNIAPVHKLKALLAGFSAVYMVALAEVMALICYLVFGLNVDFGNQIGFIVLTCIAGCLTGITFGAFISAVIKSDGVKSAILIVSNMTCAFLAGMMFGDMKYIIQQKIPLLSYINPLALITDAFYALYYYDTHTRFFINIGLLGGFTVLFSLVTYMIIRRQRYESI